MGQIGLFARLHAEQRVPFPNTSPRGVEREIRGRAVVHLKGERLRFEVLHAAIGGAVLIGEKGFAIMVETVPGHAERDGGRGAE